jgi:hypothetical protein
MIELGSVDLGFGQTIRGFPRVIAPPSGAMPEGKPIVKRASARTEWALGWNERNYITNIRFPKTMLLPTEMWAINMTIGSTPRHCFQCVLHLTDDPRRNHRRT